MQLLISATFCFAEVPEELYKIGAGTEIPPELAEDMGWSVKATRSWRGAIAFTIHQTQHYGGEITLVLQEQGKLKCSAVLDMGLPPKRTYRFEFAESLIAESMLWIEYAYTDGRPPRCLLLRKFFHPPIRVIEPEAEGDGERRSAP